MAPLSPDLVLLLLLLHLITSPSAEPYPFALIPQCRSPSSSATHRLGLAFAGWGSEVGEPMEQRLPHGLLRSSGVPESEGPASLKEVPATVEAQQEMGLVRLAAWWQSVVPAVLGVGPVDRWRCVLSVVSPTPLRGR
jgi:hypothetical protein